MSKKQLKAVLSLSVLTLALASCQIAPVNASTSITSAKGAGSKTLSALVLVDGSCQIEPDASFEGNNEYYYIEDADFSEITFTPKADGAKVKMYHDGYLTNPNNKATVQEVWTEFNDVVKSFIPEGFEFTCKEVKSANWQDSYMETIPGPEVTEWKGYVYTVSYSWESTEEYISKTKTLIGSSYEVSHLKELDDAQTPWASLTKNDDGTYTWSEAWLVNYWSVFGIADQVTNSEYFDKATMGLATDQTFSIALQEYKVGEGEPVIVKVDNKNGVNADGSLKFISAKGTIKTTNVGLIVGIVAGVVVLAAAILLVLKAKKKKA